MWRAGGKTWTTSPAWQIDGDNLDPGEGEFFYISGKQNTLKQLS